LRSDTGHLRSKRCYKKCMSRDESRGVIEAGSGSQFDPQVVKAFFDIEEEFNAIGMTMGYCQDPCRAH
jgi:putative two-component system response regulator